MTNRELLWLRFDTDPPTVITEAAEAVRVHGEGVPVTGYVPNGTSVSPPHSRPWLSADDAGPPRERAPVEPGDDDELTGIGWAGEARGDDAAST